MKVIAVFNQKGGVGKTSVSFHLGWYLSEIGKKVLLVDLDPQGNLSSLFETDACLASQIFTSEPPQSLAPADVERSGPSGPRRFSLVTADERLQGIEASTNGLAGLTKLRKALRAGEGLWDYAVIDCPPSLGGFSANAIIAAHYVLIPCTVREFSIRGMEHVTEVVESTRQEGLNSEVRILGVVLNQYRKDAQRKTAFERDISTDVESRYKDLVLSASIPASIKIEEALYSKLPVWEYGRLPGNKSSTEVASEAYLAVMKEIVTRLEGGIP